MGYDYRSSGSSPVGSVAPLIRSSGLDIRDTVANYVARVPASKVILGVPVLRPGLVDLVEHAQRDEHQAATKTGASTTVVYDTAADYLAAYGRKYDPFEGGRLDGVQARRTARRPTAASPRGASSTSTTPRRSGRSTTS
jgi:spore germination protein YaaH